MAIEIARDLKTINAELKKVNSSFRSAQKEANSLSKAIQLDPDNMKLVEARTGELGKQLEVCAKKVDLLKEAQNRLVEQNGAEVKLTPQYQKLENELLKTQATAKNLGNQLAETNNVDVSKLTNGLKTVGKVAAGIVASIAGLGVAYASQMDEIQKKVDHFGGTAEEWQLQSNAWDKLTGDSSAYESVLSSVTSTLGQVQKESSRVGTVLEQLGLTFDDLKGKSTTEALEIYLDALRSVSDEAERQAIAVSLFGESTGIYMSQMASTTQEEIDKYNEALIEAGLVTNEQVAQGAALQDTFDYLKQSVLQLVATLGTSFKPLIETFVNLFKSLAPLITSVGNALAQIGPGGQIALFIFTSLMSMLPALISMLAALHVATGNIALAALAFAALAAVSGIAIGFSVAGANNSALDNEINSLNSIGTQANEQISNSQTTTNVTNNNYYDNSTTNNNVSSSLNVDEVLEQIADKRRVMIGG